MGDSPTARLAVMLTSILGACAEGTAATPLAIRSTNRAKYLTGVPTQRKIVRAGDGMLILFVDRGSKIAYMTSKDNGRTWSSYCDVSDNPEDKNNYAVWMHANDDVYLIQNGNAKEVDKYYFLKLRRDGDRWLPGELTEIPRLFNYRYDFPSIVRETASDRIWIVDNSNYQLVAVWSDDEGRTWSAPMALDKGAGVAANGALVLKAGRAGVVALRKTGADRLYARFWDGASWSAPEVIPGSGDLGGELVQPASGSEFPGNGFSALVTPDGAVHVALNSREGIRYSRRDARTGKWDATPAVLSADGNDRQPMLCADEKDESLVCLWGRWDKGLDDWAIALKRLPCAAGSRELKETTVYVPKPVLFERVLLYDGKTYNDRTVEANSPAPRDLIHVSTEALVKNIGDMVFFGSAEKFKSLCIKLSVPGKGGAVRWEYFDGKQWRAFRPFSPEGVYKPDLVRYREGIYSFTESMYGEQGNRVDFWRSPLQTPADWAKTEVEGQSLYWVRATVTFAFERGPVADRAVIYRNNVWCPSVPLKASGGAPVFWTEMDLDVRISNWIYYRAFVDYVSWPAEK